MFVRSRKNISVIRGVYRFAASCTMIEATVMTMPRMAAMTSPMPPMMCSASLGDMRTNTSQSGRRSFPSRAMSSR